MTEPLPPQIASLADAYAGDLARCIPSPLLDARIERLVAAPREKFADDARGTARRPRPRARLAGRHWAVAAGIAVLAVAAGIFIGRRLERAAAPSPVAHARDAAFPPADFSMWPADAVAIKIPAEYSANGTLVAVNGKSRSTGTRYWVDVIVSNDGTLRIQNVVPAGGEQHGADSRTPVQTP